MTSGFLLGCLVVSVPAAVVALVWWLALMVRRGHRRRRNRNLCTHRRRLRALERSCERALDVLDPVRAARRAVLELVNAPPHPLEGLRVIRTRPDGTRSCVRLHAMGWWEPVRMKRLESSPKPASVPISPRQPITAGHTISAVHNGR
jgi:hypothetical protein